MPERCSMCPVPPDVPCVAVETGHKRLCQLVAEGRRDYADVVTRQSLARAGREPALPSAARQVAGFVASAARVVVRAATTGQVLVEPATAEARLAICHACPHYRASDDRCGLWKGCACFLDRRPDGKPGRAHYAAVACPDSPPRWGRA